MAEDLIALTQKDYLRICRLLSDYEKGRLTLPPPTGALNLPPPVPFFLARATGTITPSCDGNIRYVSSTAASTGASPESLLSSCDNARDWMGSGAASDDKLFLWRHQQSGHLYFLNLSRLPIGFTANSSSPQIVYATPGGNPIYQPWGTLPTYSPALHYPQSIIVKTSSDLLVQMTPGMLYEITETIPFYDNFTTSAGVNLNDHTPNRGASWTSVSGNSSYWEVDAQAALQKNAKSGKSAASNPPSSSGVSLYVATPTAGTSAPVEVSANITFQSTLALLAEISGGLVCRYVDADNHWIGAVHIGNTGDLYQFIYAKESGTYSIKYSTLLGQSTDITNFTAAYAGGPLRCKLRNEAGTVTFETTYHSISYSTDTNSTAVNCGIYAECGDFLVGSTGVANAVSIDNFEVRRL